MCGGFKCVRLLSVGSIFGLWRTFLRFEYMAHPGQMDVYTAIIEGRKDYYTKGNYSL